MIFGAIASPPLSNSFAPPAAQRRDIWLPMPAHPHTSEAVKKLDMEGLLKGADAAVLATLRALRLGYKLTRVLNLRDHGYCVGMNCEDAADVFNEDRALMSATFKPANFDCLARSDTDGRCFQDVINYYIEGHLGGDGQLPGVHWLGGKKAFEDWQVAGAGSFYRGNCESALAM